QRGSYDVDAYDEMYRDGGIDGDGYDSGQTSMQLYESEDGGFYSMSSGIASDGRGGYIGYDSCNLPQRRIVDGYYSESEVDGRYRTVRRQFQTDMQGRYAEEGDVYAYDRPLESGDEIYVLDGSDNTLDNSYNLVSSGEPEDLPSMDDFYLDARERRDEQARRAQWQEELFRLQMLNDLDRMAAERMLQARARRRHRSDGPNTGSMGKTMAQDEGRRRAEKSIDLADARSRSYDPYQEVTE
ncbi:hypothetical protein HK101_007178, partial [Irineochytrium annulatum]